MIFEFRIHLIAAHDRAECGGTDSNEVLPHRSSLVHGVEGRDATDVSGSKAQDLGTRFDASRGHPALDALHQMQHRQKRRPGLRIPRSDRPQLLQRRLGDLGLRDAVIQARLVKVRDKLPVAAAHRSTPPITGSRLATATTTSETMAPSHITGIACRLVKLGSRKCARKGRVPPSDTTWAPSSPRGLSMGTYACPGG